MTDDEVDEITTRVQPRFVPGVDEDGELGSNYFFTGVPREMKDISRLRCLCNEYRNKCTAYAEYAELDGWVCVDDVPALVAEVRRLVEP